MPSYCEGIVFDRPASENAEEIFADNSGAKLIGKSRRLAIGEARTLMHGRQPGPPVLPEPTARSSSACPVLNGGREHRGRSRKWSGDPLIPASLHARARRLSQTAAASRSPIFQSDGESDDALRSQSRGTSVPTATSLPAQLSIGRKAGSGWLELAKEVEQLQVTHESNLMTRAERNNIRLVEVSIDCTEHLRLSGDGGIDDGVILRVS